MRKIMLLPIGMVIMTLGACSGAGNGASETIDTLDLKSEIIIPYDSLKDPWWIFVNDSKLYLLNSFNLDTLVEEYTLDGKYVRSFLNKGNGPNEVAQVYSAILDPYHQQLDIEKVSYSLEGLNLEGEPTIEHLFTFDMPEGSDSSTPDETKPMPAGGMVRLADGSILAGNSSRGGLLALFGPDGSFRQFAADYPSKSEFGSDLPDYMVFNFMRPQIALSPDGRHFAASMGVADYLVFGELTGDTLNVKSFYKAPPKGIKVDVHDGYSSFGYGEDYITPLKYGPIVSTDRVYIVHNSITERDYRSLIGKIMSGESPAETVFTEYDFQGNQVGAVRMDAVPRSVAVSPDNNSFYMITETGEDGIIVKKYYR